MNIANNKKDQIKELLELSFELDDDAGLEYFMDICKQYGDSQVLEMLLELRGEILKSDHLH